MTQRWQQLYTRQIIDQVEQVAEHRDKPDALTRLALHLDRNLEREIRKYGQSNPQVAAILAETDEIRISYMVNLIRATSQADPEKGPGPRPGRICAFCRGTNDLAPMRQM